MGCGALRRVDKDTAEIKRMYVDPHARGLGIGRALLIALEAEARQLQARNLVLETGKRQREALGLYESAGFARIPAYGEYVGCPLSICMGKQI